MASRTVLLPLRRAAASAVRRQRGYSSTSAVAGGASPPLPPFARLPAPSEKLVENIDAVWNDGVAPELALDFDCQHIDSREGFLMWLGGFGAFATLYQIIKASDPQAKKPCVNRKMNVIAEFRDGPPLGPPGAAEARAADAAGGDDGEEEEEDDDDDE